MYGVISFLCVLASVMLVGILRNFGLLNIGTALFFSLFPLAFIAAATVVKKDALKTGVTGENKNVFKLIGLALVLIAIGWGCAPPFIEYWNIATEAWVRPILIWYAVLAVANLVALTVEFTWERKHVKVQKLQTSEL